MAEPTLAISKTELDGEIGFHLGFGRGAANADTAWDARQQYMVDAARKSGLAMFYSASAGQDDGTAGYQWSFLRPLVSLPFAAGATLAALPEDYQGLEGRIAVTTPASQLFRPVPVVGVPLVQEAYARTPAATGWPQLAAVQPLRGTHQATGQRFQLYLFPAADQNYTLQFTYFLNVNDLSSERPYPYGGAAHRETIKAACLAAAEQTLEEQAGVQSQRFLQLLQGSIALDRRNKPQLSGYNADRSDRRDWRGGLLSGIYQDESITFDGGTY